MERGSIQARQGGQVSAEFRTALQPYGEWRQHSRWGDVWVPRDRQRDWRPYTVGHWIYTNDYGWYWEADQSEADWGWVAYHYGRWFFDRDMGWVWIPGNEWAPAHVSWRRGRQHLGWAPLPPDEIITEIRDEPEVWIFVRQRDFVAPNLARVVIPIREERTIIRETVIVNRTVEVRDRRFAVNPGIEPTIIAAAIGRPLRAFEVRPRIFAGTAKISGAVEVRAEDLQNRERLRSERVQARETQTTIAPAKNVPPPQPLSSLNEGRLGNNPPRAAQGAGQTQPGQAPSTRGQAPQGAQQQGQQGAQPQTPQGEQPRRPEGAQQQRQPQGTQGRGPEQQQTPEQREGRGARGQQPQGAQGNQRQGPQGAQQQKQPQGTQGRGEGQKQGTRGRGGEQQKQGTQGRGGEDQKQQQLQKQQPQERGAREQKSQGTQGRGGEEQKQQQKPRRDERGAREQKPQATQGRGGEEQKQQRPERGAQEKKGPSASPGGAERSRTEGRGQEQRQPSGAAARGGQERSQPRAAEGRGQRGNAERGGGQGQSPER